MRLYLLPISTRRTLLYCQRLNAPTTEKPTWSDWIQAKAARTWSGWEKKEKGWQKSVVNYGNQLLRRIPYEEWGLKSVPPLSQRRKQVELKGTEKVEVVYPKTLLAMDKVPNILHALATEREALHKRRLIWCFVGMPLTAPIGLLPVIPNLPFFYLVYRAWSHWRALSGGKHVQFLLKNKLLALTPSPVIDEVYTQEKQPLPSTPEATTDSREELGDNPDSISENSAQNTNGERMLLSQANAKRMTQALDLPQLEVELERAIWQVETAIKSRNAEMAVKTSAQETSADEKKS
ncbi:mitochondrial K+-H+ exchange-related-domain-containing protein [Corynascus novoguineensis]|uniref:Mitochondrial K+-H+ exchange-related-domain-containing protein n=1 Tax=Corynascus novoguineensis TaxID=1126955 RepID=A0AAN7HKN0_9PEZI|nr:mitochondrial K+-H+ exchange-related-domain-containing protein [Corynascus novoguineensis]